MLELEIKTEAVEKRLETMLNHIETFGHTDMAQGLHDWQVEDMHRKYPATDTTQVSEDEISVSTEIFPRSRTYEQTHPHRHKPAVPRAKPALSSMPRLIKTTFKHPILRSALYDMLVTRMSALLSEKLKWR